MLWDPSMCACGIVFLGVMSAVDREIDSFTRSTVGRRIPGGRFDWHSYHCLDDIYLWMRSKAQQHASIASLLDIGKSTENRTILGLRIAHKSNLPIAVIESGVHAREWIGPPTALWFANEAFYSHLPIVRSYEWHIFPMLNPDGYVYTKTKDRMWRKNRKQVGPNCWGVDINRNFPFKWESAPDTCDEIFPGTSPSSESETSAFTKHLEAVANRTKVYVSLHSYTQSLMYPWAYTTDPPSREACLAEVAKDAATALKRRYGTRYHVGRINEVLHYLASGSALDFAYSLNIPFTFVFELRPSSHGIEPNGYELPAWQIVPTAQETHDAVLVILRAAALHSNRTGNYQKQPTNC